MAALELSRNGSVVVYFFRFKATGYLLKTLVPYLSSLLSAK